MTDRTPPSETRGAARERDRRARLRAQTEFGRALVLEAGAGTGKTSALVARVLAWCVGPGWERAREALGSGAAHGVRPEDVAARVLGRVVAITFTEAAAAEMASRVGEALATLEAGGLPQGLEASVLPAGAETRRERAAALRGALDHLVVRTIHAWCLRLLTAHPIEAGVHPRLRVDADERLRRALVREVLEARLGRIYAGPGAADALALATRGVGPPQLEVALDLLVCEGVRAEELEADPWEPARTAAALGGLLESAASLGRAAAALAVASRPGRSQEALEALQSSVARLETFDGRRTSLPGLVAELGRIWPDALRKRLHAWARGKLGKTERVPDVAALERAAADFEHELAAWLQVDVALLDAARRVLAPLLAEASLEMRARGIETFTQILLDARDLLRGHAEVAARLRSGIDQLLVDEFQDTDAVQCDIVATLALEGPVGERPGLFLVGDPKQSIYGWRNADLRAYDAFVARVLAEGGEPHALVVNFRSVPAILEEVERVVAPVMERVPGLQPVFQSLAPCPALASSPGYAEGDAAPVEHWVAWDWDAAAGEPVEGRAARAAELEAEALARDLRALRVRGVAWRSVGVLFRAARDLDPYLMALRRAGIPFHVDRDQGYYRRREVIEAGALVRAVLDPNDALALLGLLRSAWVGVPDAALIPLWAQGLPRLVSRLYGSEQSLAPIRACAERAAAGLPADVPGIERVAGWEHALVDALQALAELREAFDREPADRFVERLRTRTLLEGAEAARYLGAHRLANLERFFRELAERLEATGGDRSAVLRELRSDAAEDREADEGRPQEAPEDAVRILTIHQAKGLDFEHVYLLQLHRGRRAARREAPGVARDAAGRLEFGLFGSHTPGFAEQLRRREEVDAAERVRTLYVAMTRARCRLVLSGRWPRSGTAEGHMALVARRSGTPDLEWRMAELAREARGDREDGAGVRWVFPALARTEPAAPAADASASVPDADAVRAGARTLDARRVRARERAARPFGAPASAGAHEALESALEARAGREEPAHGAPDRFADAKARAAMAVGSAVHAALETFDFEADPQRELERGRERIAASLRERLGADPIGPAARRATALLERFAAGPLWARLRALSPGILARELPVLLAPEPEAQAAPGSGPVGFWAGAVDLLYRDPQSAELVVADYKTDRIASEQAFAERRAAYAEQGRVYLRAVREALGLDADPRFELWFLETGRIERL